MKFIIRIFRSPLSGNFLIMKAVCAPESMPWRHTGTFFLAANYRREYRRILTNDRGEKCKRVQKLEKIMKLSFIMRIFWVNLFILISYSNCACFAIFVYKVRILCSVHICSCLQEWTFGIAFIKENISTVYCTVHSV